MNKAFVDYSKHSLQQDFTQQAINAWASYQITGKHLTGEEMDRWLDSWCDKRKVKIQCHR